MRFSAAVVLSCAISAIASPIVARDNNAAMAADAVTAPEAAADVNAAQDHGERLAWRGADGSSCSGRVKSGVVHIKRKKGGHHVMKADAVKVLACLNGYYDQAAKDLHFMSYLKETKYYYLNVWDPNH